MAWGSENRCFFPLLSTDEETLQTPKRTTRGQENIDTDLKHSASWGNEDRWSFSLSCSTSTSTSEDTSESIERAEDNDANVGYSCGWGGESRWNFCESRWNFSSSCRISRTTSKEETPTTEENSEGWGNESRWSFSSTVLISVTNEDTPATTGEGDVNGKDDGCAGPSSNHGNDTRWKISIEATSETTTGDGGNGVYHGNYNDKLSRKSTRVLQIHFSWKGTYFMYAVITLLMLAVRMVTSAVIDTGQLTQLQPDEDANLEFSLRIPPDIFSAPTYILKFDSMNQPFVENDELHAEGFRDESQLQRFKVKSSIDNHTLSVNLTITSVTFRDHGMYVLKIPWHGSEDIFQNTMTRTLEVHVPPGKPKCYITASDIGHYKELHCHATCGSSDASLTCFQDNQKAPYKGELYHNRIAIKGVFWMKPCTPIYCCSHIVDEYVTQETCTGYQWAPETRKMSIQPASKRFCQEEHHTLASTPSIDGTTREHSPVDPGSYRTTHEPSPVDSGSYRQYEFKILASLVISVFAHIIIHQLSAITYGCISHMNEWL